MRVLTLYMETTHSATKRRRRAHLDGIRRRQDKDVLSVTVNPTQSKRCWWCHMSSETVIGAPMRVNKDGSLVCSGSYCSLECIKSNMRTASTNWMYGHCLEAFDILCRKVYHISPRHVGVAPHFSCMKEYGGPLTREEYNAMKPSISRIEKLTNGSIQTLTVSNVYEMQLKQSRMKLSNNVVSVANETPQEREGSFTEWKTVPGDDANSMSGLGRQKKRSRMYVNLNHFK